MLGAPSNMNDTRAVVGRVAERGKPGILFTFGHAWLMLRRFLGVGSRGYTTYVVLSRYFGEYLLALGIQEEEWGYFLRPYRMTVFCLEIGVYILQTAFDMLTASRTAIDNFRRGRESTGWQGYMLSIPYSTYDLPRPRPLPAKSSPTFTRGVSLLIIRYKVPGFCIVQIDEFGLYYTIAWIKPASSETLGSKDDSLKDFRLLSYEFNDFGVMAEIGEILTSGCLE
ncbi:hypothetical protein BT96DRAFT_951051 [Gymnopus androsaceus JB14]|uniref:Uncharacterized protein n=1 Tax=Gymnopus androsaceus JB14 TaxID=1447944 RepID=A0A6A4GDZ6_9AGAR|nr:hypothetical protein BT96DRAFT_951051 [Gymnopus androsaceus JB14]